jgi:hypothetical protein
MLRGRRCPLGFEGLEELIIRHGSPATLKEKARIPAGALASLVIVAWLIALAIAFLSMN